MLLSRFWLVATLPTVFLYLRPTPSISPAIISLSMSLGYVKPPFLFFFETKALLKYLFKSIFIIFFSFGFSQIEFFSEMSSFFPLRCSRLFIEKNN